ncbi:MAG: glycosyltransferase [Anaerolineae bacterium]
MVAKTSGVRILFTGQYWPGANSLYISRAFEQCGAIVRWVNDTRLWPEWTGTIGRVARRLLLPVVEAEWNRQVIDAFNSFKPDLVYITNADYCRPETLAVIRQQHVPIMCFYHDPPWKNRPGSRFEENITLFDLIATTRQWHEAEFKEAGAKEVAVVRFGYDPLAHFPVEADKKSLEFYGTDITFVGTNETRRTQELTTLVSGQFPYSFRLWGGLWDRLPPTSPILPYWQGRPIFEQEIPIIYACSKIALHWLNHDPDSPDPAIQKGDQHKSRTFQIPACGNAIMLAQRSAQHEQFFKEDVEAVFFSDIPELREKLAYWLAPSRDEARRHMADAARARCLKEDYTYVPVVRQFLKHFDLPGT